VQKSSKITVIFPVKKIANQRPWSIGTYISIDYFCFNYIDLKNNFIYKKLVDFGKGIAELVTACKLFVKSESLEAVANDLKKKIVESTRRTARSILYFWT
jgi:hypothetical protein